MKIRAVSIQRRKARFVVNISGHEYAFPFSQLRIRPTVEDPVMRAHVDPELGNEAFTYKLRSGREDSVHLDHVLYYHRDPKLLRDHLLNELTHRANRIIEAKQIPKREICRRLETSPTQVYRLLDPTFYGKTIDLMVRLLFVLGEEVTLGRGRRAA